MRTRDQIEVSPGDPAFPGIAAAMESQSVDGSIDRHILDHIEDDDGFTLWCLMALFGRQTQYEQQKGVTIEKNGVGFSASHAKTLTPIAREAKERGSLTEEQLAVLRRRNKNGIPLLGAYKRQIVKLLEQRVQ